MNFFIRFSHFRKIDIKSLIDYTIIIAKMQHKKGKIPNRKLFMTFLLENKIFCQQKTRRKNHRVFKNLIKFIVLRYTSTAIVSSQSRIQNHCIIGIMLFYIFAYRLYAVFSVHTVSNIQNTYFRYI